jgi:hypothetical protein
MPLIDRYKGMLIYNARETNYRVLDGKEVLEVYSEATGALVFRFSAYYNPRQLLTLDSKEKAIQRILARALERVRAKIDAGSFTDEMQHFVFTRKELVSDAPAPSITLPFSRA